MNVLNSPIECKNGEHWRSAGPVFASDVDQEIVRRSALGAMTYLVLGLAVLLAATQLQEHAGITRIVGIAILLAAGVRLGFRYSILLQPIYKRDWRWWGFRFATYGCGLSLAMFCCATAMLYPGGPTAFLLLTTAALLTSIEMVALSPDAALARSYLIIVLAPTIACCLIQGDAARYTLALVLAWYVTYMWFQIQRGFSRYLSRVATRRALSDRVAELENELNELRDRNTREQQAFRAQHDFLVNINHEICTPLIGLIGMVDLLEGTDLTPEQRDFLHTIRQSGDALLTLVDDVLDSSASDTRKPVVEAAEFDLRALIENTASLCAEDAHRKGLTFGCAVDAKVPSFVSGDPVRLRLILDNLLSNAVKFTREGEIALQVESSEAYGAAITGKFIISDTGVGIPPDTQERLSHLLTQADSFKEPGGTGFGLLICKRLVKMLGGQIGFESSLDEGSIFWFSLPLRISESRTEESSVDLRQARILVVDDNATNLKILQLQLTALGGTVYCVNSGADALEALLAAQEQNQPYHAVIMDQQMPQMDVVKLAKRIRSKSALNDLVMILLSPKAQAMPDHQLEADGFSACIPKPARLEQLRACLIKTLRNIPASSGAPAPAPAPCEAPGRLLLVENNLVNQKVATRILTKLGYYVEAVSNGAEAIERCEHGIYDALLIDCKIPAMDGYATAREIRRRQGAGGHTIIIGMTASATSGDREKCLAAGMDDYVSKPIRSHELQRTLQRNLKQTGPERPGSQSEARVHAGGDEFAVRLKELEHEVGPAAMLDLMREFLRETAQYLEGLRNAISRSDPEAAFEMLEGLVNSSANVGATRLMELCSKFANQRGPLEDCAPVLSELMEAHRNITNELQDMYPAHRFDVVYRMDAEDVEPIIALGDLDRLSLKSSLGRHQEPTRLRGTQ